MKLTPCPGGGGDGLEVRKVNHRTKLNSSVRKAWKKVLGRKKSRVGNLIDGYRGTKTPLKSRRVEPIPSGGKNLSPSKIVGCKFRSIVVLTVGGRALIFFLMFVIAVV